MTRAGIVQGTQPTMYRAGTTAASTDTGAADNGCIDGWGSAPGFARALDRHPGRHAPTSGWRARLAAIDWTPDLGRDIGSRDWWRGVGSAALLCGAALATWPGIRPIPVHAATLPAPDRLIAREQTIRPMAWGSDTARHSGPTRRARPLAAAPERPRIETTATMGQGDSFTRLLERNGVAAREAARIASMAGEAVALPAIRPGTRIDLILGRRPSAGAPRPVERIAFRAALDLRLEFARSGSALRMTRVPIAVDETPLRVRGRVGDRGIYRAATAAGAPAAAIQAYLRVIAGQISLTEDVRASDSFDIIVARRRAATGEAELGELLYAGLNSGNRARLQMLPWTVDGRSQWFEASGVGEQRAGLAMPVSGRATSSYGMRRHPILGYVRMHAGMDFGAPYGSPIYAVTDGTVNYAGYRGGYGQFVRIDHGRGMATGYGHMSRIAARQGQQVRRGDVIGYVGSTGLSTGPHLHYEMYRNGQPINPATAQFTTRAALSGPQLAAFRARLRDLTKPSATAPTTRPLRR